MVADTSSRRRRQPAPLRPRIREGWNASTNTTDLLDVLNPREIWLTVVIVAGLNLTAYVLSQVYGMKRGIGMTAIMGGMISSTAVTFEFARRSQKEAQRPLAGLFALAIAIASAGMFLRVLVLTLLVNSSLGVALLPSMLAGCAIAMLGVGLLYLRTRQQSEPGPDDAPQQKVRSPFALRPALQFGLVFAIVLWVSTAAQVYLSDAGVYLSGVLGGFGGLDAVTLSMARLSRTAITETVAVRSITLGTAANRVFKGGIATLLGAGEIRRSILPLFLLAAAAGVAVAFLAR